MPKLNVEILLNHIKGFKELLLISLNHFYLKDMINDNNIMSLCDLDDNNNEFIYLIKEREFIKTKEPIYKIGKTKQENLQRIKSYPNGSILLLLQMIVIKMKN